MTHTNPTQQARIAGLFHAMNYASLYPRQAVAPMCSTMTLIKAGVTSHKLVHITRPSAETAAWAEKQAKSIAADGWALNLNKATNSTSPIPNDVQEHVLKLLPIHLNKLREGQGHYRDWMEVFAMLRAMVATEKKGWFSVQKAPIIRAWDAMLQLQERHYIKKAGTWAMPLAATADEMDALDEAYAAHAVQLSLLTRGDFLSHIRLSMAWKAEHLQAIVEGWRADLEFLGAQVGGGA